MNQYQQLMFNKYLKIEKKHLKFFFWKTLILLWAGITAYGLWHKNPTVNSYSYFSAILYTLSETFGFIFHSLGFGFLCLMHKISDYEISGDNESSINIKFSYESVNESSSQKFKAEKSLEKSLEKFYRKLFEDGFLMKMRLIPLRVIDICVDVFFIASLIGNNYPFVGLFALLSIVGNNFIGLKLYQKCVSSIKKIKDPFEEASPEDIDELMNKLTNPNCDDGNGPQENEMD